MAYADYLKEVTLSDGSTTYTIPIWNVDIRATPWHSSGETHVQYFHGKHAQRIQGFVLTAEFDMNFSHNGVDDQNWSDLLNDIDSGVVWTLDFDPSDPGIRSASFVLDQSAAPLSANFRGHVRNRPTRTRWISPDIITEFPWWITCPDNPNFLLDVEDYIFLGPSGIVENAGTLESWTNAGTLLSAADFTYTGHWTSGQKPSVATDPIIGKVMKVTDVNDNIATGSSGLLSPYKTLDNEIWLVVKFDSTKSGDDLLDIGSQGSEINQPGGKIGMIYTTGGSTRTNRNYRDDNWHVVRVVNIMNEFAYLEIDGKPIASGPITDTMFEWQTGYVILGDSWDASNIALNTQIAMLKITAGVISRGRTRKIYGYLRDSWQLPDIPADGTEKVIFVGQPNPGGEIHRIPVDSGEISNRVFDGTTGTFPAKDLELDEDNEWIYFMKGNSTSATLWRVGYVGDDETQLTTNNTLGGRTPRAMTLDPVNGVMYVSSGASNGNYVDKHSVDVADAAVAWTSVIPTGSYETYHTLEWNTIDSKLYFIDSLAGTPSLRKINGDGTGDTKVADLTAGKVYWYMKKDPDENVYYISNHTDGTIDKYDVDSDTLTAGWHTPTYPTWGIDILNGFLYYVESTTNKVFKVDMTTPGSRTELADYADGGTSGAGIKVSVFDTRL